MLGLFLGLLVGVVALVDTQRPLAIASDCPLDLGWSNFTLAASVCSNPNERGKCCRYINAFVAVSVARYASSTGKLGVPSAFSEMCLNSVSETLQLHGIPSNAMIFCGLGTKILVTYQCEGRATVLEMLQSPNFTDVTKNCKAPISLESSCKRCLNSGIIYLHHLIGAQDNVTLSTCRDATFVALANQDGNVSPVDMASCFFGVQGLNMPPVNVSEPFLQSHTPAASPSVPLTEAPSRHVVALPEHHHHPYHLTLVPVVGIAVMTMAMLLVVILILLIHRKRKELKDTDTATGISKDTFPPLPGRKCQEGPSSMFRRFSYKETKIATDNFSLVLGKGGFGTVYRAEFSADFVVAVKRMNKVSGQGEDEFCREMELLGRLHHRHLVALRGFCIEKRERFLMYEHMENGSLKDHLHSPGRTPLSWQRRIQIAIDVANALEYLHFYCDPPLFHQDINSSNIFLDENFVAKVSNFGPAHVSRSGSISFEPVSTDIPGSLGYVDPEFAVTQELTDKSDIYSYGVLLLELVTGRCAVQENNTLLEWSQKFMATDSKLPELVDPVIRNSFDLKQLQVIVGIIQWCTRSVGEARPSVKQVLRMLYERLDAEHCKFVRAIEEDDEGGHTIERINEGMAHQNMIPHSGEPTCLQSSSSTSISNCSQSLLLESGSPESPPGIFSL
uniref:Putative receptor-like protein kinase At1g49730 n=1 Tax=Anthurium amnicola TaxID=1678845 RepID=A0A1D1XWF4_9ARAE